MSVFVVEYLQNGVYSVDKLRAERKDDIYELERFNKDLYDVALINISTIKEWDKRGETLTKKEIAEMLVASNVWNGINDAEILAQEYTLRELLDALDMLDDAEEEYYENK